MDGKAKALAATLLLACCFCLPAPAGAGTHRVKGEVTFRRIGFLSSRPSYGQIHGSFDFGALMVEHSLAVSVVNGLLASLGSAAPGNASRLPPEVESILRDQLVSVGAELAQIDNLLFVRRRLRRNEGMARDKLFVLSSSLFGNDAEGLDQLRLSLDGRLAEPGYVAQLLPTGTSSIARLTADLLEISKSVRAGGLHLAAAKLERYLSGLRSWGRAAADLLLGRVGPAIVSHSDLTAALQLLTQSADAQALRPLAEDAAFLYGAPISVFSAEDRQLTVVIHVLLSEKHPMELLEYLPAPLPLGTSNLTLTLQSPEGRTYLASAEDSSDPLGVELSAADLGRCARQQSWIGPTYTCPKALALVKNFRNATCLGSLALGAWSDMRRHCRLLLDDREASPGEAVPISQDEVMVNEGPADWVKVTCEPGGAEKYNGSEGGIYSVGARCRLETPRHTAYPAALGSRRRLLRRDVSLDRVDFLGRLEDADVRGALDELRVSRPGLKCSVQDVVHHLGESKLAPRRPGYSAAAAAVDFTLLCVQLCCVAGFLAYWRLSSRCEEENLASLDCSLGSPAGRATWQRAAF
jgi:hypothetical protein